jgi:hypothetical membrane protein
MTSARTAGALALVVAFPAFLLAQVITSARSPGYRWATNNISDLGNVTCGIWDTTRPRFVCSPGHALMNTAIVLTAVLLGLGTLLTWRALGRGAVVRAAQVLLLLTAMGYGLAGAFPADVDENWHFLGALLILGLGNLGLLIAGFAPHATPLGRLRALTVPAALVSMTGAGLFFTQHGGILGVGGMERVAVFPLLLWAALLGAAVMRSAGPSDGPGTRVTDCRSEQTVFDLTRAPP